MVSAYSGLPEDELTWAGEAAADRLTDGDFGWILPEKSSNREWARAVGAQIRGLDHTLATTVRVDHGPVASTDDWLCDDGEAWVVPRRRARKTQRRTGQPYSRRGLVYHRILPRQVMGYPLRLVVQDTLSGPDAAAADVRFGAALFEGLELVLQSVEGGFVATGVSCPGQEQAVTRQIASAYGDRCLGVVWPELAVTPALRVMLGERLRERALDPDPAMDLQLVVAGSWHEQRDGEVVNVTTILDGYGRVTLEHRKLVAYVDRELGPEAIALGREISVLVTGEHLLAFGICRDFCDVGVDLPYPLLDVDFVLVPSMGGEATMRGHCATAQTMRVRYGALTFVVQQRDTSSGAGNFLGFVLAAPDKPSAANLEGMRQEAEWASHPATIRPT